MTDKGHLIINEITLEQAIALTRDHHYKYTSRWWPKSELAKLDSAAVFAILTHGYPKIDETKVIEIGKIKEGESYD